MSFRVKLFIILFQFSVGKDTQITDTNKFILLGRVVNKFQRIVDYRHIVYQSDTFQVIMNDVLLVEQIGQCQLGDLFELCSDALQGFLNLQF